MKDQTPTPNGFDIARLATIPHGDSATALGRAVEIEGPPTIPALSGFPEGVAPNIVEAVGAATRLSVARSTSVIGRASAGVERAAASAIALGSR